MYCSKERLFLFLFFSEFAFILFFSFNNFKNERFSELPSLLSCSSLGLINDNISSLKVSFNLQKSYCLFIYKKKKIYINIYRLGLKKNKKKDTFFLFFF